VLMFLGALGGTAYMLTDDAARAIQGMPQTARRLRETIQRSSNSQGIVRNIDRALDEVQKIWDTPTTSGPPPDLRGGLMTLASRAGSIATQSIALMFLIFFMLATGDSLKAKLVRIAGQGFTRRRVTITAVDEIIAQVGYFVVYLIVSGALVGGTTWLAFWWLGVAYAPLWGIAAGLLNAIPYLGPAIVLIAATAASLVQFESFGPAAAVGGVSLAITSFEGFVLTPLLFSKVARIHPVILFLSIMFWSWIWGPIGTFLAVPIVTAVNTVFNLLPHGSTTSEILSDESGPSTLIEPSRPG
jgi:predicted PurR-regulated permease PerM